MNRQEISEFIKVKEPYLWLDEVTELTEHRIVATKRIEADLPVVQAHYDGFPLFPGSLQCEACFQASNVLLTKLLPENPGHLPVIARVNNVKFKKMVRPGDQLTIEVELHERQSKIMLLSGRVFVDGKVSTSLEFVATEAPIPEPAA